MTQGAAVTGRTRRTAMMRSRPAFGRHSWGLGLVMAVLLGLTWTNIGPSAPGDLDHTFGTGRIAITFGPGDFTNALVVQPDGNLLVAGTSSGDGVNHVLLARYLPDGRVDGSFGPGGKVTSTVGAHSGANAVLQQPDGNLVVAGFSTAPVEVGPRDVLLARYLPDGRLDASFGIAGVVTADFGGSDEATALVLQRDSKLVAAGGSSLAPHVGNTILARFHPDGSLDGSFGVGGKSIVNLGGASNGASALLIQPDGKLVVTGFAGASPVTPSSLVIARFQPDGSLDPTFGQAGKVTFASFSAGQALIQQPDGKLIVTGSFGIEDILLARYQALGCPSVNPDACRAQLAAFVTDVYLAALGRQPDAGEVSYWVDVVETEPTPDTARNMLHVVFDGPEFRQRPVNPGNT